MSASIDVTGLAQFSGAIRRAVAGELQKELVHHLHQQGPIVARDIKGSAFTKIQRRAAGTVTLTRDSDGVTFKGGGGGGLGGVLWAGGEYGGRKSKKKTYATRSRRGTPYVVNRRTTMQFLPHLGNEGYFYWPAIRDAFARLSKEQDRLIQKALEGGF